MGIEPMHAGATIQCVNHFTKAAINSVRNDVSHYALTRNLTDSAPFGLDSLRFRSKRKTGNYLSSRAVASQVLSAS